MKLKTLKELDCHDAISIFAFRNELRQEAIKHIKELTHPIKYDSDGLREKHPDCKHWLDCDDYYSHCRCHIIIGWIKGFFNISEDDLK